jgi:ActR/RegA family two-component response regulator
LAEPIETANEPELSLLIVDDDEPWLNRLARAMESRGYSVACAASVAEGVKLGKSVKAELCRYRYAAGRWKWAGCG